MLKFRDDPGNRIIKRDEELCIMTGKLEEVQALVVILINLVNDYYSGDKKNPVDYTLRMLIPSNYVTKLIGQSKYFPLFRGLHDQRYHRKVRRRTNKDFI